MSNPRSLKPYKKGQSGNLAGKPKGNVSRKTIARSILQMDAEFPDQIFAKLKQVYPTIEKQMSVEEIMTWVMVNRVITKADSYAYEKIMDTAYGKARQEIEISDEREITTRPFNIIVQSEETRRQIENLKKGIEKPDN